MTRGQIASITNSCTRSTKVQRFKTKRYFFIELRFPSKSLSSHNGRLMTSLICIPTTTVLFSLLLLLPQALQVLILLRLFLSQESQNVNLISMLIRQFIQPTPADFDSIVTTPLIYFAAARRRSITVAKVVTQDKGSRIATGLRLPLARRLLGEKCGCFSQVLRSLR